MIKEFIEYLKEQVGQPYLWGGQHTKLTLDTNAMGNCYGQESAAA